jgi:hypothetical protein
MTVGPMIFLRLTDLLVVIMGGLGTLFFLFGLQVLMRCVSFVEIGPIAIAYRGIGRRSIAWQDLEQLKISYFAPRRQRSRGWYRLTLEGPRQRLHLDSTIEGFDDILRASLAAARTRELTLDPTTHDNLVSLGHQALG